MRGGDVARREEGVEGRGSGGRVCPGATWKLVWRSRQGRHWACGNSTGWKSGAFACGGADGADLTLRQAQAGSSRARAPGRYGIHLSKTGRHCRATVSSGGKIGSGMGGELDKARGFRPGDLRIPRIASKRRRLSRASEVHHNEHDEVTTGTTGACGPAREGRPLALFSRKGRRALGYFNALPATTAEEPNFSRRRSMAVSVLRARASAVSNRAEGASAASATSAMPMPIRR